MRLLPLLVVLGTASALAPLLKTEDAVPNRYIVKLKDDADLETVLRKVEFAAALDRNIKVTHTFTKVFDGFSARLTNELLQTIRNLDIVEYVEEDSIVKIAEVASWGLDRVDQLALPLDDSYHPIGDGDGVLAYVLDTGINEYNKDFGESAVNAYDATGEDGVDCHGHGSYSCGIVGGKTFGVAKSAHIFGIRVVGCNGYGLTSDVIKGCDWVIENGERPAVASISVETSASPAMDEGVQALINNLIQVVVAAGNEGTNACKKSPARVVEAITVGATDIEDVRAHFSNYGTCVDIFAPGVDIASVWISGNDATNIISGTSVATPHVAGAAAILLGLNNQLSPKELKKMLQEKAIVDAVKDAQPGSPNLLLYIGEGSGGGADPRATSTRLSNTLPLQSASTACYSSGLITISGTDVCSPGYPFYDNNQFYRTEIQASYGQTIKLSFSVFSSEECCDMLFVYDGDNTECPLETLKGDDIPPPIYSTKHSMVLVFSTDGSITHRGYLGTVTFIGDPQPSPTPLLPTTLPPAPCNISEPITTSGTDVTSPGWPNNYGNNLNCLTKIEASYGQRIKLSMSVFSLEMSCSSARLEVYDGDTTEYMIDTLCDSTIPDPVYSFGPSMTLVFYSDDFANGGVYLGTVSFIGDPLPTPPPVLPPVTCNNSEPITISGTNVASPGYPDYYMDNMYCRTEIQASYGQTIKLIFSDFYLECPDSLKVYEVDGYGFSYELADLCGYGNLLPIYSSGPSMILEFSSDDFFTWNGYLGTVTFIGDPKPSPPSVPPPAYCNTSEPITISGTDVASPGYPDYYMDNLYCRTEIQASYGQTIKLSLSDFLLDCSDRLEVYDGIVEMYPLGTLFCGSSFETPICSTTSSMVLEFFSDDFYTSNGYLGTVTFIGDPKPTPPPVPPPPYCNTSEPITISGSEVASPGYPDFYIDNMFCRTEIQASYGQTIKLSFSDFSLDCSDHLEVYDGIVEMYPLETLYCGSSFGTPIYSTTSSMVLEFFSDCSYNWIGYLGTVTFIGDPKPTPPPVPSPAYCNTSEPITISGSDVASPGYPDYIENMYCRIEIQASYGQTIKLSFFDFSLDCSDHLEVYDGIVEMYHLETLSCGSPFETPIYSTTSSMVLEFSSHSVSVSGGYLGTVTFMGDPKPTPPPVLPPVTCNNSEPITISGTNVASPGYPDYYMDNLYCITGIQASYGQTIKLSFSVFSLHSSDNLVVHNDNIPDYPLATLSGSSIPAPIYSYGPFMTLEFSSEYGLFYEGYLATVTFIGDPIPTLPPAPLHVTCDNSETITSSGTDVASPGYPDNYGNNLNCRTEIQASHGQTIKLSFSFFRLHVSDNLVVFDGDTSIAVLSGSDYLLPIYSTGPSMRLEFLTDSSATESGYLGSVTFIEGMSALDDTILSNAAPCGDSGPITTSGANVTSPGWPNDYGNDLFCFTDILASYDETIMLTFSDFSLEHSSGCSQDVLAVYLDDSIYDIATLCGSGIPPPLYSKSFSMTLLFITDSTATERGYFGTVTFIPPPPDPAPCSIDNRITISGTNVTSPGWPNEYGSDLRCSTEIHADPDQIIMLTFSDFSLEYSSGCSQDKLEVYDGYYSYHLETLCDSYIPGPIYSTGSSMTLDFITDSTISGSGYFATVTFIPKPPEPAPCDMDYYISGTNVTSPGWPNEYDNDLFCTTEIHAGPDEIIMLSFSDFSLEYSSGCSQDALVVVDDSYSYVLETLCDSYIPGPIYSTGPSMLLEFFTDSTVSGSGYFATVTFIPRPPDPAPCINPYITTSGTNVTSPGWPNDYGNDLSCWTDIQADFDQRIMLTFSDFSLEYSSRCSQDRLVVYDDNSYELETLCDTYIPGPIYSTGSSMRLEFSTDSAVTGRGYFATVTFIPQPVPCSNPYITTSGTNVTSPGWPNEYGNNLGCTIDISAGYGERIMLTFSNFSLEYSSGCSQDRLVVYDGYFSNELETLCDTYIPGPIYSTGPVMTLEFITDSAGTGIGFFGTVTFIPQLPDPAPCSMDPDITTSGTNVASPGWPNEYGNDLNCWTRIRAGPEEIIMLTFSNFSLEYSSGCWQDQVAVVTSSYSSELCGSYIPAPIYSTDSYMDLNFITDSTVTGRGYFGTVEFISLSSSCDYTYITTNGSYVASPEWPNEYGNGLSCITEIQADTGHTIMLTFSNFNLEHSSDCSQDKLVVYNDHSECFELATLCGSDIPAPIYSTGPYMALKLVTDSTVRGAGYLATVTFIPAPTPPPTPTPAPCDYSGPITTNGTVVTSPGWPNDYDNNLDCFTDILSHDPDQIIMLSFSNFGLEYSSGCSQDNLTVYYDYYVELDLVTLCGSDIPEPFYSTGPYMSLQFLTDSTVSGTGYFATVTFIPQVERNEQIKTSGTNMTSPGWPNTYRGSLHCFTEIHASYGEIIALSFSDFNLEYSASCTSDNLKVYDHDDALLEKLCGSGVPPTIYSNGPRMRLEFYTDYAVSGTGYFGTVTFITQILTDVVSSPGWPNNYDDNLACSTHIQASDGQTIMLTFSDFDIEPSLTCSYDKLTIYDGDSVNGNKLITLCGSDIPAPVYSTGPSMLLVFSTDDSVANSGYRGTVTYIGGSDPSALRVHPTTACESKKTDPNGNLTTPGYPSSYDLNMDCWTHIHSKDATKTVTLTFNAFEVEEQSDCNFDSVLVYDGVDKNAAMLGKFCGSTLPPPVSSSGPDMFVKFHSDGSVIANGVHATYAIS